MPRKSRLLFTGIVNHIIQRGNNKEAVFFEKEDYRKYSTALMNLPHSTIGWKTAHEWF